MTDGGADGHASPTMGKWALPCVLATAMLAVLAACNGKIAREDSDGWGGCSHPSSGSTFCDNGRINGDPDWGSSPPLPGPDFPIPSPSCQTFLSFDEEGISCRAPRPSSSRVGSACSSARDCPGVCCRIGNDGAYHAVPDEIPDASADVDAVDADAGDDAATTVVSEKRTYACTCGVCPSAEEICRAVPHGLGGP